MVSGQSVLVVDGLSETEQVLKAVLEPRGLRVDRVRRRAAFRPPSPHDPAASPERRTDPRPSLVVLHTDGDPTEPTSWRGVPRVIIGSARFPETTDETPDDRQYLPHPFHYRELIGAIERLLSRGSDVPAA